MKRVLVLLLAVAMSGALLAHQPEPKPSVTPPRSPTYPAPAAQKSDPAIDQLLRDYLSAFSKGDAKALAALYTEDAIRVGMNNQVLKGRAAIEQFYVASFAGGAKPPVLTVRAQSTRMVTPDVAVTGRHV